MNKKIMEFMKDYQYSKLDMYENVSLSAIITLVEDSCQRDLLNETMCFASDMFVNLKKSIYFSSEAKSEILQARQDTFDDIRDLVMFGSSIEEGCLDIVADVYRKCAYFIDKRERA